MQYTKFIVATILVVSARFVEAAGAESISPKLCTTPTNADSDVARNLAIAAKRRAERLLSAKDSFDLESLKMSKPVADVPSAPNSPATTHSPRIRHAKPRVFSFESPVP